MSVYNASQPWLGDPPLSLDRMVRDITQGMGPYCGAGSRGVTIRREGERPGTREWWAESGREACGRTLSEAVTNLWHTCASVTARWHATEGEEPGA